MNVSQTALLLLAVAGVCTASVVAVPRSDEECKWSFLTAGCANSGYCAWNYKFGDFSLDQACRLRNEDRDNQICPNPTTVANVDVETYFSGRWFEISKSNSFNNRFEKGMECITADYYLNKCNKNPVVVVNSGILADGSSKPAYGKARQTDVSKFEVSFFANFFGPYWVIHTEANGDDSAGVAIVFSCSKGSQDMWVLSRTPELPPTTTIDKLFQVAVSKGIDVDALGMVMTQQGDAFKCAYPSREELANRPSSDEGCTFGLTGCKPSSWCSYQFKWGDFTPSQSCRVRPSDCDAGEPEKMDTAPPTAINDDNDAEDAGSVVPAVAVVSAAVVSVAGIFFVAKRRRGVVKTVDSSYLRA